MIEDERPVFKRIMACEHCGGDKPWARADWYMVGRIPFCSKYCADNFDSFLDRLHRQGKKVKV